jgi:NDP-sugar pyrophosphorylase family protein
MQVIVPIAGRSIFFPQETYYFPKSLIEVGGRLMIERVVENLSSIDDDVTFIFVVQQDEVARFSLDRTLKLLAGGNCIVLPLRQPTRGSLCSALLAIDYLEDDRPLVIANGDQVIGADLKDVVSRFRKAQADAGVIVFNSVHPRWSYVDLDASGQVQQAAEKQVISRDAIAGFYFFETSRTFIEAAKRCIENNASVDGQFYIAPCLNEIILNGGSVLSHRIATDDYHSFYSPEKINQFEDELLRRSVSTRAQAPTEELRVVIPAAGEGSRFRKAGYAFPKPFIRVLGRPMIDHVIENVAPSNATVNILLRRDHAIAEEEVVRDLRARGHIIHEVEKLTEGTACTILLARQAFDDDKPLLIANSDQFVDFSVEAFVRDCIDRNLDGSILVFRDTNRDPKWSFARIDEHGLVLEVAEKKPISDLATVGIYLFRRGSDFVRGAIDMIARNDRVNNEFYTCPVYNYLIARGLRIGVYEVPAAAMHGLGTPEDLVAFIVSRGGEDGILESQEIGG